MNPSISAQKHVVMTTASEATTVAEQELLMRWGFTPEESASLLWLRRWYQNGGSDRVAIVRYLEFLKLLVTSGELEL